MKRNNEESTPRWKPYVREPHIRFGREIALVMSKHESLRYNIFRLVIFAVFTLLDVASNAESIGSVETSIPCVDTSFRAVILSSSEVNVQTGIPKGPFNPILRVINVPSNSATNDWESALVQGLYGYGSDRLAANRTFTPTSYARHLNMLKDLFGKILAHDGWSVLDKQFSDTNLLCSAWREDGKSRILWCERHFLSQGVAHCVFYARRYSKGDGFKLTEEISHQGKVLENWEEEIAKSLSLRNKKTREFIGEVAQCVASSNAVEALSGVWVPVPAQGYLNIGSSNVLSKLIWPMTEDKFLSTTLVCCFPTNRTKGSRLFDSDIGLPAVRQLDDDKGARLKKRNYQKKLETLVHRLDYLKSIDFRVGLAGLDQDKWVELDRFWGDECLRYSACIESREGFKVILSHRHFLLNEQALYLSIRKDFKQGEDFNAQAIAKRQSELLANWEKSIRKASKITTSTSIGMGTGTGVGLAAKTNREVGHQRVHMTEDGKPFGASPTTSERAKSAAAALDWLKETRTRRASVPRYQTRSQRLSEAAKRSGRTWVIFVLLPVTILVVVVLQKLNERTAKDSDTFKSKSSNPTTNMDSICHFCDKIIPIGYVMEISLIKVKTGLNSQTRQIVRCKIPCCSDCADLIRRESRRTILWRAAITMGVYIACVVVISANIRAETLGLAILAGCIMSVLPACLAFVILVGLKPMPFTPSWHRKVAEIPQIKLLIENGFRLNVVVKYKMPIPET